MSFNNYGGGGVPNPWGNSAGNFQANPGMGGFAGNSGINLNIPPAQLAVGLISNLLTMQQQQQQPMQQPNPNMMGMGGMGTMNNGYRQGSNPGYSTRSYSPPRRRFRSPSPRRHQQTRRPPAGNSGKSYADNRRRMPVKRDHVGNQQNRKRPEAKNDLKKKPETKKDEDEKHEVVEQEQAQTADNESSDAPKEAVEESKVEADKEKEKPKEEEKAEEKKREGSKEESPSKGGKKEDKSASYEGLPVAAFRCHLCKKSMWDARSFDNHVRGIAHLRMLDKVENEYAGKAKTLREACHAEESRIQQDLEYQSRVKNKPLPSRRDFCKMCDMVIYGSVLDHRRSSQHQALKNHLHPKCSTCQIDLPSRIDLDIHVLTAAHLKRLFRDMLNKPGKDRKGEREQTREKSMKRKIQPVGEYNPDVAVGEDYLTKVNGIFCELCHQFFFKTDESLKTHCKTEEHYAKLVAAQAEALQAEKEANEKEAAEKTEEEPKSDEPEAKKIKQEEDAEVYNPFNAEAGENAASEMNHDRLLDELEAEINNDTFGEDAASAENANDSSKMEETVEEERPVVEVKEEPTENQDMQDHEEAAAEPAEEAENKSGVSPGRGRARAFRRGRGRGRGK